MISLVVVSSIERDGEYENAWDRVWGPGILCWCKHKRANRIARASGIHWVNGEDACTRTRSLPDKILVLMRNGVLQDNEN